MAFKEVLDLNADTTVSLGGVNKKTGKKNPTQVEGYYLGSRSVEDTKKKSGKSYIYVLQTPKGNLGVWGKTDLDRKMGSVPKGTMIRITQSGMAPTKNGEMYKFKVEVDNDNVIEVASSEAVDNSGSDDGYEDSYGESDEDTASYSSQDADEDDARQDAALAAAAARKAKVDALLKRK